MSKAEAEKTKLSFLETIRVAWRPYRRLYGYAAPYKWRLAVGILFGLAFGLVNGALAWVSFKFQLSFFTAELRKERKPS